MDIDDLLSQEFSAEPGSFLLQLRCDLRWDTAAFTRLTGAMLAYARAHQGDEVIPRWVAEGFCYVSWFVRDWSTHESFPREHPPPYYDDAYQRLHDLAYWLFTGTSPYESEDAFDEL